MKIKIISAIWCPSCLIMQKKWASLKKKYPQIVFEEYDYDEKEELCKSLQIGTKLPVCICYKEEKEVGRWIGEKTEAEMIEEVEKWLI